MRVALVTGSAGFIGYHVCKRLLAEGIRVVGVDALTDYYDIGLKRERHAMLLGGSGFEAVEARI
jgi:UDP-glucuronate 4-epimerase